MKVPAPPASSSRATSGSSASRAVAWKKKIEMRQSTARMAGDSRTNCTPTRMALARRSRPSGLSGCTRRQRMMVKPATSESTAFSTNTQWLPRLAMMAPASSGPMMREAFIATPLSASAAGSCWRLTSSGTMAANTGQRMARPMPLAKVSASSTCAVMPPLRMAAHSTMATPATQNCVIMKYLRRSRMSARAPLGRPRRNTGAVDAVCTSATSTGEVVSVVMSQAVATSFIHMQVLATIQVPQSMRNTGTESGAKGDCDARSAALRRSSAAAAASALSARSLLSAAAACAGSVSLGL